MLEPIQIRVILLQKSLSITHRRLAYRHEGLLLLCRKHALRDRVERVGDRLEEEVVEVVKKVVQNRDDRYVGVAQSALRKASDESGDLRDTTLAVVPAG